MKTQSSLVSHAIQLGWNFRYSWIFSSLRLTRFWIILAFLTVLNQGWGNVWPENKPILKLIHPICHCGLWSPHLVWSWCATAFHCFYLPAYTTVKAYCMRAYLVANRSRTRTRRSGFILNRTLLLLFGESVSLLFLVDVRFVIAANWNRYANFRYCHSHYICCLVRNTTSCWKSSCAMWVFFGLKKRMVALLDSGSALLFAPFLMHCMPNLVFLPSPSQRIWEEYLHDYASCSLLRRKNW